MVETAGQGGKLNVFISYSRDDLDFADQLDAALGLGGFETTIDRHGISAGEDWKKRLGDLILHADTVVFALSPSSARSEICAWEVEEAVRLGKRILPVLCRPLGGVNPPHQLSDLNYIYFYKEPKSPNSGFGTGLVGLASALNTDLDWLREHTRYLQRATEWDAGDRSTNRLLSGPDIAAAKAWAVRRPKNAPEPTALQLDFIKTSEAEEIRQQSAEAQRLKEMAEAQAERSRALAEREQAQDREAEAQKREVEAQKRVAEEARRVVQRTRLGLAGVLVLFVVAAGVAIYAFLERDRANMQHALAVARQLATEARATLEQDGESASKLERSLLVATASLKFAWTEEGFEVWSKAMELMPSTISVLGPEQGPYRALAFSRDGARLAVAGKDAIIVMDSASLNETTPPKVLAKLPQVGVTVLAFKPSDDPILVAGAGPTAIVWSLSGSQKLKELRGDPPFQFKSLAFDSQGKRLAAAGMNYYARVFETEDWTEIGRIGNEAAMAVAFSPDDRWLLTVGARAVAWNIEAAMRKPDLGNPRVPVPPESFVVVNENHNSVNHFVSFSEDGRWMAESGGLRAVIPSDAGPFRVADKLGSSHPLIAVSSDARLGATAGYEGISIQRVDFDTKEFRELGRLSASTVAFARTGDWLASAADDRLERWNLKAGAEWRRLVHGAGLVDVAVSPDARFLATTTADGFVHVWETSSWREIFKAETHRAGQGASSAVEFSADGRWLAATSQNVLKMFSTNDWEQMAAKDLDNSIDGVAFSPDSKWVIAKDGPEVTLIAVNSLATSHFPYVGTADLSISPDGRQIVISRRPTCERARQALGLAQLWEISSRQPQGQFDLTDKALPCHLDEPDNKNGKPVELQDAKWQDWKRIPIRVNAVTRLTRPDGTWILEMGLADSIEIRSGAADQPGIPRRAGNVTNMALSPNGRWAVTTSDDGVARIWALDRDTMIAESCARLRHDLSSDDWSKILGGEPYSAVCPGLPTAHQETHSSMRGEKRSFAAMMRCCSPRRGRLAHEKTHLGQKTSASEEAGPMISSD